MLNTSGLCAAVLVLMFTVPASATIATDPRVGNNVCDLSKKDLSNGTQNPDGSCATTVLGEVPSKNQMVSTVIRFPANGATLHENEPFTIRTKTINLATGFFDDPKKEYVVFPQTLNNDGVIQGHSHVTVQKIVDDNEPLDPEVFAFFKGLYDPADGKGELAATVDKGLPAGRYRVCTMVSAYAHQPVTMPVEQRGAQDDCVRFTVEKSG